MPTFQDIWAMMDKQAQALNPVHTLFYKGDHWQGGAAWNGPLGDENTADEIASIFTSRNIIKEITNRQVNALIGTEPRWSIVPIAGIPQPAPADESDPKGESIPPIVQLVKTVGDALVSWFDGRDVMKELQKATREITLQPFAYIRLWIPPGLLDLVVGPDGQTGPIIPLVADLSTALDYIWFSLIPPGDCIHWRDQDTMQEYSARRYMVKPESDQDEKADQNKRIELSTIRRFGRNDQGVIIRLERPITDIQILALDDEGHEYVIESVSLDLGGHLLTHELRVESPIIDPAIIAQQRALNVALTMRQHNLLGAGFLERVLLNAQLPGRFVDDPDAVGGKRYIPDPYHAGLGSVNSLVGVPIRDEHGSVTGYANPDIWTREPSSPESFNTTEYNLYTSMLASAGQLFAVLSGDAVASGQSRTQALADFMIALSGPQESVVPAIRWLIETALFFAGNLQQGNALAEYSQLRSDVSLRLKLPPKSADEQRVNIEKYEKGTQSLETTMVNDGKDDPDAEKALIAKEKEESQRLATAGLAAGILGALDRADAGDTSGLENPPDDESLANEG